MESHHINRLLTIITVSLISGASAYCQPPLSEFYPVGTTWEEVDISPSYLQEETTEESEDSINFSRYEYVVEKDTIVGRKTFKIVSRKLIECVLRPDIVGYTTHDYYREENDSVFIHSSLSSPGSLVFNWGEKCITYYFTQYNIENESFPQEMLLDGNLYDYYSITVRGGEKKIYKSIGQTIGGLVTYHPSRSPVVCFLTKFTRNNVLIYQHDIPSPHVNSISNKSCEEVDGHRDFFTLQGTKIHPAQLTPGIYIQNGKKVVIR